MTKRVEEIKIMMLKKKNQQKNGKQSSSEVQAQPGHVLSNYDPDGATKIHLDSLGSIHRT
tara:strand:- start:469 stop:648 length:180 start_codon:yes stop_codon:yes gene_type:complete